MASSMYVSVQNGRQVPSRLAREVVAFDSSAPNEPDCRNRWARTMTSPSS